MPLDPTVASLLASMKAQGGPEMHELGVAEVREVMDGVSAMGGEGAVVATIESREVASVPIMVYTPQGDGPFGVLVWLHGGGWVMGAPHHYHATCQDLAAGASCVVVSIDYRLAPEHKAPAAVEDCLAATSWVLDHTRELGGDPSRVVVGGDSVGGNLAAVVSQVLGRRLSGQLLITPIVDALHSHPSVEENGEGYYMTKAAMHHFSGLYLDGSGVERTDPRVSPIYASDDVVSGAPAAFVLTAEFDPMRDEGDAYAKRLAGLGVPVEHHRYDGMIHGFYTVKAVVPAAQKAIDQTVTWLREVLRSADAESRS
ncbi:MAG: alpha/beta hydrolase [Myxococcota bacterium]